ncbi:hypothetical protein BD413DRAFT_613434 [Trametes elegans]|nr:hypothetical protein BD413DRAFT_613434 [Trametes elegans]
MSSSASRSAGRIDAPHAKLLAPTDGTVELLDEEDVRIFTQFWAQPKHPSSFDTLHVSTGRLSSNAAAALEGYLRGPALTVPFEELVIDDAELVLGSRPSLESAFAGLRRIDAVDIKGAGPRARNLLKSLQAPLASVVLEFLPLERDPGRSDPHARNPIALLANFQATLESLFVCGGDITSAAPARYPKVLSVTLRNAGLPRTAHLVQAFPALETLQIHCSPTALGEDVAALDAPRAANLTPTSWRKPLDHVHGTLSSLFVLHLQGGARGVRVAADMFTPLMLVTVLADTRPQALALEQLRLEHVADITFGALMSNPVLRPLDTLELLVELDEHAGMLTGLPRELDAMINALRVLRIRSFSLTLACTFSSGQPRQPGAVPSYSPEAAVRDLKFRELADRLREAVPSVQNLVMLLVTHPTRSPESVVVGQCEELMAYRMCQIYSAVPA